MKTPDSILPVFANNALSGVNTLRENPGVRAAVTEEVKSGRFEEMLRSIEVSTGTKITPPSTPGTDKGQGRKR